MAEYNQKDDDLQQIVDMVHEQKRVMMADMSDYLGLTMNQLRGYTRVLLREGKIAEVDRVVSHRRIAIVYGPPVVRAKFQPHRDYMVEALFGAATT